MQTLSAIKAALAAHGLSPRKAFGQNFLVDHNLIRKLVDASGVQGGSVVLEVGPGTGALTDELVARGCVVVAAEIDRGLCALLRERFAEQKNFVLVEGDCLDGKHALAPALVGAIDGALARAGAGTFHLVANLPYGAATPLLLTLFTQHVSCAGFFVTIQREVADRLCAREGTKEYGPLSVVAQVVCEGGLIAKLPPECFWPRPLVTSAMVGLTRRAKPLHEDPARLLSFLHTIFEQRRKQIGSALKGREFAWPSGVRATDRAEALSVEVLIELERAWGGGRVTGR